MTNKLKIVAALFGVLLLAGCPSENDLLVNPEPVTNSVRIRVLNLSSYGEPLSFRFDIEKETESIGFGEMTALIQPPEVAPYDSVLFEAIGPQGDVVFMPDRRPRLFRNIDFTYILVPSIPTDSVQSDIRRILLSQTTPALREDNNNAYLKVLSGIDKQGVSVSLKDGCQSGTQLAASSGLGLISASRELASGERVVSLVVTDENGHESIGSFSIDLPEKGQFLLLVLEDSSKESGYKAVLLDEQDESSTLAELQPLAENSLSMRVLNLGEDNLTVDFNGFENAFGDINGYSLSEFRVFGACQSINPDTLWFDYAGLEDTVANTYQLNVEQKYTVANLPDPRFVDANGNPATKQLLIEPVPLTYNKRAGFATVRVVNAIADGIGVTLSVASNSYQVAALAPDLDQRFIDRNYVAGTALASSLSFGNISGASEVAPGKLPLALFTAANPAQLLATYLQSIEADREYTIFLYGTPSEPRLTVVEDQTQGGILAEPEKGAVVQVVNAHAQDTPAQIDVQSVDGYDPISSAKLAYTNSLTTILPIGDGTVIIDGQRIDATLESENRLLVIVNSDGALSFNEPKMNPQGRAFSLTMIHAAPGGPTVVVRDEDRVEKVILFDPVSYGENSPAIQLDIASSKVFYVYDVGNSEIISADQDIPLDYYKSYYLILSESGESRDPEQEYKYRLIVAQEF